MKKYIVFLLCLIMILSLLSCDIENQNDNKNNYINSNTDSNTSSKDTSTTSAQKTQAEIAMEMYDAVLENEIKVYQTNTREYSYLADCRTPYACVLLRDCENLRYTYTDIDGDSTEELVIDCSDTLILRYYEGVVYLYPFTFRNLYYLNTDGSYSWNHNGQNFEYGEKQLAFEGAELKTKELWRIVNDGEPNAEYYIEGKQVTQEEILKYFEDNPKSKVKYSQLEAPWINKISRSDATRLAKEYWKNFNIEDNGYIVEVGVNDWAPSSVYVFIIRRYVVDHYSTFDEIWIDKTSGEAIIPYAPDGKG